MKKKNFIKLVMVFIIFCFVVTVLPGCIIRTRKIIRQRVDQDLSSGNRGYIFGTVPPREEVERKKTRKTYEIEVELSNPFAPKNKTVEPAAYEEPVARPDVSFANDTPKQAFIEQNDLKAEVPLSPTTYIVGKGDTLQKISDKFYGTTLKWKKIYEANQGVLKSPDRVYPGQKLVIPVE